MAHEVEWAESALDDLLEQLDFIARDSISYAAALSLKAEKAAATRDEEFIGFRRIEMRHNVLGRVVAGLLIVLAAGSCATLKNPSRKAAMTGLKMRVETPFLQEAIGFYTRHIGMTVIESWDEGGDKGAILGLADSSRGEAFLELGYTAVTRTYTGVSLQFRVQDLSAVAARLQRQWEFRGPEERPWGSTYLYLKDPAGVQVIVYEGEL